MFCCYVYFCLFIYPMLLLCILPFFLPCVVDVVPLNKLHDVVDAVISEVCL